MIQISVEKRNIEKIEREGSAEDIYGVKSCKSFRNYLQARINDQMKWKNIEMEMILKQIMKVYNRFHPELKISVVIPKWKGKAGIAQVIEKIDSFDVIRFRKKHKDAEPEPFINNIQKSDVNFVIEALKNISKYKTKEIKTEEIAAEYCRLAEINKNRREQPLFEEKGFVWSHFFGWRIKHVTLTDILGMMNLKGLIDYKVGLTKILDLNKKLDFQTRFGIETTRQLK